MVSPHAPNRVSPAGATGARAAPPDGRALLRPVAGDPGQEARARKIVAATRSYVDDYSVPIFNAAARVTQGQPPVALHVSSIDDVREHWDDA